MKHSLNEYQEFVRDTSTPWTDANPYIYPALGLGGEAGEVIDLIKKQMRRQTQPDQDWLQELKLELGDVLWYLTRMAHTAGFTLEDIAAANTEKLNARRTQNNGKHFV